MNILKRTILGALLLVWFSGCIVRGPEVEYYTFCDTLESSPLYRVSVDGREVFVLPTEEPHIAQFGCGDAVNIEVEYLAGSLDTVSVRPLGKGYAHRKAGNKIQFTLSPLDRVSVEVNGDISNPLFIFANPLENPEVRKARRDPKTDFFGAGKIHNADTLRLGNGRRLYIEGGAVVRGILHADSAENITVSGCGYLDSRFSGKVRAVEIFRSRGVALTGFTLLNSDYWSCVLVECDSLELYNFKSIATASSNQYGHENDAIDLVGCRNAKLRHCFAYAHDDAYCIKARKWNWGRPVSNISFEDCIGWNVNAGNTFEIGYEAGYDISNISYEDIYSIHSGTRGVFRRGAVSIHNGANATISDVTYRNVFIEDPAEYAIHIAVVESTYNIGNGVKWDGGGHIRGIRFDNVQILRPAPEGSEIYGVDDLHAVEDVVFRNLYIAGRHVLSLEEGDFRKAVYCRNIVFE